MRRNICFLFAIVAFAATAAGRCPGIPKTHCAALHSDVTCSGWSYKVRTGATRLPHSHRNNAGAVVARRWCKVEGYDQMGRGGGWTTLCDATGRGADRVCRIPKMLRHQYDSLQCSCDFPSWVGK